MMIIKIINYVNLMYKIIYFSYKLMFIISLIKFINQVVWTCFIIYFIEISRDYFPPRFFINKAVDLAEFTIDLLNKLVIKKL